MSLTIKNIRESGLLELYVLGDLGLHENSEIEAAIQKFPELKSDLVEIEKAFYAYGAAHAVQAPQSVIDKVLDQTKNTAKAPSKTVSETTPPVDSSNSISTLMKIGFWGLLATTLMLFFTQRSAQSNFDKDFASYKETCEKVNTDLKEKVTLYQELSNVDNKIIEVQATEKYPETKMIFNTNEATKRNFIQFKFLPELNNNQSYQLWSLKPDSDPIPLTVFEDISELLEVAFEEGTNAYAITIEPKGGQDSPTLENLIGVFPVSS